MSHIRKHLQHLALRFSTEVFCLFFNLCMLPFGRHFLPSNFKNLIIRTKHDFSWNEFKDIQKLLITYYGSRNYTVTSRESFRPQSYDSKSQPYPNTVQKRPMIQNTHGRRPCTARSFWKTMLIRQIFQCSHLTTFLAN